MSKKDDVVGRRDFFKKAGLLVGAAGGATVVAATASKADEAPAMETKTGGYRETEHVSTYYKLASL